MRRPSLAFVLLGLSSVLAACGDSRPGGSAEHSVAVSSPAAGVPERAAPQATATPEQKEAGASRAKAARDAR